MEAVLKKKKFPLSLAVTFLMTLKGSTRRAVAVSFVSYCYVSHVTLYDKVIKCRVKCTLIRL